ncbi:hypothetical protein GB937_001362 [Aspergillus fischeri]|nr:hypothetical protein GB937_001362 [Aspergillus fischeri]
MAAYSGNFTNGRRPQATSSRNIAFLSIFAVIAGGYLAFRAQSPSKDEPLVSKKEVETIPDGPIHACISDPGIVQHKPLLVFLHYWGGFLSTWYKLTSPDSPTSLSASYPTASIDHRGWGKSTGPSQDDNTAYSISSLAKDVALVLQQLAADQDRKDTLKHEFILIGHSMGAKVAMATLTTLPGDLLNRLRGVVLVAPAPPTPLLLPPEVREQQEAAYETAESVRWSVNHVLANPENLDEKDIEMVVRDSWRGNQLAKTAWPTYGMAEDVSDALQRAVESMDKEKHLLPLECPEVLRQEILSFC